MKPTFFGAAIKIALGLVCLAVAAYIFFVPADQTAWLTQYLYRLQEPIDGHASLDGPHDWSNVTIGLALMIGTWTIYCGLGDAFLRARAIFDRRAGVVEPIRYAGWTIPEES